MDVHFREILASVVSKLSAPVFLAGYEQKRSSLTLHVRSGLPTQGLRVEAERALTLAGLLLRVDVRRHRLSKLTHPRSLEHWLRRFGTGEILHDPTHIASRARGLIEAANSCRSSLGNLVGGNFFDADRRSLVVYARIKNDAAQVLALRLRVASVAEAAWQRAVACFDGLHTPPSQLNVRVVSDVPVGNLVPVDSRSASLVSRLGQRVRRWIATGALAVAALAAGAPAHAKLTPDLPTSIQSSADSFDEWGVLSGLSVFVEGGRQYGMDAFASTGLRLYFGDGSYAGTIDSIVIAHDDRCYNKKGKRIACPPVYLGS